jgi:5-methylcytosine-specific restriction enzyme subunit McrC
MSEPLAKSQPWKSYVGIPVRNLWMLLAYASDLARFLDRFDAEIDESADIQDLLARLLIDVVERRLHKSLSKGYVARADELSRVRGRIDWLETETGRLLQRGKIACRFEELTQNTTRNRLVRAALIAAQSQVSNRLLAQRCAQLGREMQQLGVTGGRPSRAELSQDQISRNDSEDRLMVTVAQMSLDMSLPAETEGHHSSKSLDHDEYLLRKIFEKSIAGFYRHELQSREGWKIRAQKPLHWQIHEPTAGLRSLLPSMSADLVIDYRNTHRTVVDTKFTGILTKRFSGQDGFKSAHIYQLFSYLKSQIGQSDHLADSAGGILLHPAIDVSVDESVVIQGHKVRFVTIDLSRTPSEIRQSLLNILVDRQPALEILQ